MEQKARTILIGTIIISIILVVSTGIFALSGGAVRQSPSNTECSDRIDNDGDGYCDYSGLRRNCRDGSIKGDSGCSGSSDNTEASCVEGTTTCGTGACQRSSTCSNDQVVCTPGSPSTEVCDSIDNDCDGVVDDNLGQTTCGIGACQRTVNNCINGQSQTCTPGSPSTEICGDLIDNDCDNYINEGCGNQTNSTS